MLASLRPASVLAQYPHLFPEQYTLTYRLQKAKNSSQRLEMKLTLSLVCPRHFLLLSTWSSREHDVSLVSSSLLAKVTSQAVVAHDLGGCVSSVLKLPNCKSAMPHSAQQATDHIVVKMILFLSRSLIKMHSCTPAMVT